MTVDVLTRRLRRLARYHSEAADRAETQRLAEDILLHRKWIVDARKVLEQLHTENGELKTRLVKQACYFENIEARHEPKQWPLMNDDDPGAAL